jgi:hypothetical protein
MRLVIALVGLPILVLALIVVGTRVIAGPPASERLAGVTVLVVSHSLGPRADAKQDLRIQIVVTSARSIDDCLAFTLDEPFATRRLRVTDPVDGCLRPRVGTIKATVLFDRLADDDLLSADHTLVWGVTGGKCGVILPLFGICAVDQAGTADLKLPVKWPVPFPSFGTFVPFPTFSIDIS